MSEEEVRRVGVSMVLALGGLALGVALGAVGRSALDESDERSAAVARAMTLREAADKAYRAGYRDGHDVATREAATRENRAVERAYWDGAQVGFENGKAHARKRRSASTVLRGSGGA